MTTAHAADFNDVPISEVSRLLLDDGPEESLIRRETVLAALNCVNSRAQAILYWHEVDGLTYREIGKLIGRSAGRAHQINATTLRRIRRKLKFKPPKEPTRTTLPAVVVAAEKHKTPLSEIRGFYWSESDSFERHAVWDEKKKMFAVYEKPVDENDVTDPWG